MIKVVELAPSGEMKVRHFDVAEEQPAARVEAQPTSRKEQRERRVTVQESGNLYRIRHGMEPSKPSLRLGGAWLAKAGFTPGAQVRVRVEDGRIMIEA